jgi:hypothetical protein
VSRPGWGAARPKDGAAGLKPSTSIAEGLMIEHLRDETEFDLAAFPKWVAPIVETRTRQPLNFNVFPFQPEMYAVFGDRRYRQVVCRKCTQIGMTELSLRWAIFEADHYGSRVLYVFPTLNDVYDFSDERVTPLFEADDYLRERVRKPFNKGLKKIGIGFVYLRGSENKRGLDSVAADALVLDEYDTLNQANIPDAERRLSSPLSAGLIRRVGVPSHPDFGIGQAYDRSDRRKWLVQCHECEGFHGVDQETNEPLIAPEEDAGWQELNFWRNVYRHDGELAHKCARTDDETFYVGCENCAAPLDVGAGVWMAQRPEAKVPGFHVSRLMVPITRLEEIVEASRKTSPYEVMVFYTKDLGLPYSAKSARLTPEDIAAAVSMGTSWNQGTPLRMVPYYLGDNPVVMGVDVASERALNVVIYELVSDAQQRLLWAGEIDDDDEGPAFAKLPDLMHRYRVSMAGIDHLPERKLARGFANAFPGRVYLVKYATGQKVPWVVDDPDAMSSHWRFIMFDTVMDEFRRFVHLLPEDLPDGYVGHLTANTRKVVENEVTREKTVVWEAIRADDYGQAEVYCLSARELYYRKLLLDDAGRDEETVLDDHMPFKRSSVNALDDIAYRAGPGLQTDTSMDDDGAGAWMPEPDMEDFGD